MDTILGSKVKMSQTFVENRRVPVTLVEAGPCIVTAVKTEKTDGYWALQLGFGKRKMSNITKPMKGHLKGAASYQKQAPRFLCEVRLDAEPKMKVGDEIKVSEVFSEGDVVAVRGVSRGKGFAGVVKRWGFAGGPKTHGQSDRHRAPGSIGQGTTPGRVRKGKKMAGRMGGERVTIKNLKVVSLDGEKNEMALSGPVPGSVGGLLVIRKIRGVKDEEN
jgi:large subunit ribosomal protein L3